MIETRRASERGRSEHGWLSSRHTFSFGSYFDPKNMGFSVLRVINDDQVAPGHGFGTHSHRDMEILSYVLEGELEHKDSMGHGSVLRPGQIQLMSAGRGVTHSEFNHSSKDRLRFLQIWIEPDRKGEPSDYQETKVPEGELPRGLRLIASPSGEEGSLRLKQDARVYAGRLSPGESGEVTLAEGRVAYVHVACGTVHVLDAALSTGDGASLRDISSLRCEAASPAEVLVFDLPSA